MLEKKEDDEGKSGNLVRDRHLEERHDGGSRHRQGPAGAQDPPEDIQTDRRGDPRHAGAPRRMRARTG